MNVVLIRIIKMFAIFATKESLKLRAECFIAINADFTAI